jgi:phage tail sheath protein FI
MTSDVYIEQMPSGIEPIAGVATSIAGFIGEVTDGMTISDGPGEFQKDSLGEHILDSQGEPIPTQCQVPDPGEPRKITSWQHFKTTFGDFQEANWLLAHAVHGFFTNGGTCCYVSRVSDVESKHTVIDALRGLEAIDEISLVAVPGAHGEDILTAVIDHCEADTCRIAILDGQRATEFTVPRIKGEVRNSSYAAMYFPWIRAYDPVSRGNICVPPSGHIAGVYARVDAERGVHKAPANQIIRGALGVESRVPRMDEEDLHLEGINVIRDFDGDITLWGTRTLGGEANGEWKYVNVRRLSIFIKESIDKGTKWVVFEPNGPELWAKIRYTVGAFMHSLFRQGAFAGMSQRDAYFVKCGRETTTQDDISLGSVNIIVGFAPLKPSEFMVIKIGQIAGEIER